MTLAEIAEREGITPQAVRQRLNSALAKLRRKTLVKEVLRPLADELGRSRDEKYRPEDGEEAE